MGWICGACSGFTPDGERHVCSWKPWHRKPIALPEGAVDTIRQTVASLPPMPINSDEDEPCVCDTDFTCMAREHVHDE